MTVQFILPEATSFPKERKLHDRLFLVLLYNLLCKTFKDHSSTFAASSRIRAHPSFARALLPDCECKGRAFLHSLQDFDEKKCEKNSFVPILLLHSMAKSVVKSVFSLHPLPIISPQNRPFSSISAALGTKSTFFGVFFSSAREKFLPEISFYTEKISLTGSFCLEFARISTFADEEKEEEVVFSSNHRRSYKTRKVLPKNKHKDEKTQGHHGKAKGQNQKANVLHRKDQAQASKTSWFSSPPPLRSKNTSRLSLQTSPLFATSSLVLSQTSLPRTKSLSSYAQDTRLRVYTRLRTQRIFHFCLHPSPHRATNCISVA